jgi:hypothetical protein
LVGNFTTGGAASLACNVTGSTTWTIFSFTSTGVTSQNWTGGYSPAAPAGNHCVTGDFNGDGLKWRQLVDLAIDGKKLRHGADLEQRCRAGKRA